MLEVHELVYAFKKHLALDGLSFSVASQSIHGFVGPNGAGKTTTLKLVSTLLLPRSGWIRVFGLDVKRYAKAVRRRIGLMPDHFGMYPQMKVFEYLDFFAAAYGQSVRQRDKTIEEILQLTDMHGRRDSVIKGLSRGMQQRLSLARVLVHDPDLLLLDEPASGLDPRARVELMEILRELARMGKTILISSHILSDLAQLCDSVTIIDRGQVKYTGSMGELLAHQGETKDYELVLERADEALVERLRAHPGVVRVAPHESQPSLEVSLDPERCDARELLRVVLENGAVPAAFNPLRRHLDKVFMDLTEPGLR